MPNMPENRPGGDSGSIDGIVGVALFVIGKAEHILGLCKDKRRIKGASFEKLSKVTGHHDPMISFTARHPSQLS
jgi:hypothetical protein